MPSALPLVLLFDIRSDEIVSRGRQISRCYHHRNVAEFLGHAPGTLEVTRVEVHPGPERGRRYLVAIAACDPVSFRRQELVNYDVLLGGADGDPAEFSIPLQLPTLHQSPGDPADA